MPPVSGGPPSPARTPCSPEPLSCAAAGLSAEAEGPGPGRPACRSKGLGSETAKQCGLARESSRAGFLSGARCTPPTEDAGPTRRC